MNILGGIFGAMHLNDHWFIDASVLLSRTFYSVNHSIDDKIFIDADIRFTQMNLNLNLILNPASKKVSLYLFGGTQVLYRRWGEERYVNDVIAYTYWPTTRMMAQTGAGLICKAGNNVFIQPFAGFRHLLTSELVYDTDLNQIFTGINIGFGINSQKREKHRFCPTDF